MADTNIKLYETESEWDTNEAALEAFLGIPIGTTVRYAVKDTVSNSNSSDFGKYIMPVIMSGPWQCDDQFSSGVVDWQDDWNDMSAR